MTALVWTVWSGAADDSVLGGPESSFISGTDTGVLGAIERGSGFASAFFAFLSSTADLIEGDAAAITFPAGCAFKSPFLDGFAIVQVKDEGMWVLDKEVFSFGESRLDADSVVDGMVLGCILMPFLCFFDGALPLSCWSEVEGGEERVGISSVFAFPSPTAGGTDVDVIDFCLILGCNFTGTATLTIGAFFVGILGADDAENILGRLVVDLICSGGVDELEASGVAGFTTGVGLNVSFSGLIGKWTDICRRNFDIMVGASRIR